MSEDVISRVTRWVESSLGEWLPGTVLSHANRVVLAGRREGRATLVLFPRRGRWPAIVVKIAQKGSISTTAHEYRRLTQAQATLAPPTVDRIPYPLGLYEDDTVTAMAATAVRGYIATLPHLFGPKPNQRTCRQLSDYISASRRHANELAHATRYTPDVACMSQDALVEDIDHFLATTTLRGPSKTALSEFRCAVQHRHLSWQPVWQHGDASPGNLLIYRGQVSMVDWEAARPSRPPWHDDAQLAARLVRLAQMEGEGHSLGEACVQVLGLSGWPGPLVRQGINAYWPHPLPFAWCFALTVISLANSRGHQETVSPVWTPLVTALLCDDSVREACDWAVPHWDPL